MVVGLHNRDNDLVVNPVKTKQFTNIRVAGKDGAMLLTSPIRHTLESARIHRRRRARRDHSIRIRAKRLPLEHERKRASRAAA
jgi:GTP-binding protein